MKNILIIVVLVILGTLYVSGQDRLPQVLVKDIEMDVADGEVNISFLMKIPENAVSKGSSLIITPVLYKDDNVLKISSVIVEDKYGKISRERNELATGASVFEDVYMAANGGTVAYSDTFRYEDWMSGADLRLSGAISGCSEMNVVEMGSLAANLIYIEPAPVSEPVTAPITAPKPAENEAPAVIRGEKVSFNFPFVAHVGRYGNVNEMLEKQILPEDQSELYSFIDANRDGSVTVYFRQGAGSVDYAYADNQESLVQIVSAIRFIEASTDSRIAKVVISGFASPEGSADINKKLAGSRADALREFIIEHTAVTEDKVKIYNGSVDWKVLRDMVLESDMSEKDQVIDIMDNTPVWDAEKQKGRLGQIMRLNEGNTYQYMYENFFPKMRNAAYIIVYYDDI